MKSAKVAVASHIRDDSALGEELQLIANLEYNIRMMQAELAERKNVVLQVLVRDEMHDFFRVDMPKLYQAFRTDRSGQIKPYPDYAE